MAEEALELYSRLQLYIPNQDNKERDVQAKYSIQRTDSNVLTSNGGRWKRFIRVYQCQCGVDHTTGRFAAEKRQVPWKNVGCMSWIKLTTTHDTQRSIYFLIYTGKHKLKAHIPTGQIRK